MDGVSATGWRKPSALCPDYEVISINPGDALNPDVSHKTAFQPKCIWYHNPPQTI